jgi:hypothetical protein
MSYTVTWDRMAENELATIWINAQDKEAVRRAADFIDAELRSDPYSLSESRSGNARIMVIPPLVVRYAVQEDDRKVIVRMVWRWGRRPSSSQ